MQRVKFIVLIFLFAALSVYPQNADYLKQNYDKRTVLIPMRDGVKLTTNIYSPKDKSVNYPILLLRTPYRIGAYKEGEYSSRNFPSRKFIESGYIFVFQDVRGKFMSEGEFEDMRPYIPGKKSSLDADETSDSYDTIDWLVKNVENNNGKVGIWGISYPGFYAAMAAIDSHPNLVCVSPQAPISNWFIGDDMHHNGAFSLLMAFNFFKGFGQPRPEPTDQWTPGPSYDSPDAYNFFLNVGALKNLDEKYLHGKIKFWNEAMSHGNYDEFWQSRNNLPHFYNVNCSVMTVGGWFDSEDLYGPLHIYESIEEKNPGTENIIVMGPWTHGGWARSKGAGLASMDFGGEQSRFYRDSIWFPYFEYKLKGGDNPHLPEAYVFGTGENRWRKYDVYPPANSEKKKIYFRSGRLLSFEIERGKNAYDEFPSDPSNPVPYTAEFQDSRRFYNRSYMAEDQRFAASRPDVLVYQTEPLDKDVTIVGPITADLFVSTTGTDADWVVKIIDVFPDSASNPVPNPDRFEMGGIEQLIRYDIMRGKYRNSFENPEPFTPGEIAEVKFALNDIHHTFKAGHKIMVQVQSSMFPFFDRNPQTFCDIYSCGDDAFIKAVHRVYHDSTRRSNIEVNILNQ